MSAYYDLPSDYYVSPSDNISNSRISNLITAKLTNDEPKAVDPDYKFDEGKYVSELKDYIDSTYSQHYAVGKLQATEFIIDMGDGLGFTRGNVIKYAKRYGQKAGYNRADLMKVLHYSLMMLYVHDLNNPTKGENA